MKIAVQLYTIREPLGKDFWGTLDKVAAMGYRNVQLAGLFNQKPEDVRKGLDDRGLTAVSPHVGLEDVEKRLEQTVQMAKVLGCDRVTVPWVGEDVYRNGWQAAAERFNAVGQAIHNAGIMFSYHNHAFEFKPEGGRPGYDVLWDSVNRDLVQAEIDLYWVQKGGGDPVRYLNLLRGDCPTLHFKDMTTDDEEFFCEVGHGRLDWAKIIPAAIKARAEFAIVEHDAPRLDPLESIRISRDFLIKQGLKD